MTRSKRKELQGGATIPQYRRDFYYVHHELKYEGFCRDIAACNPGCFPDRSITEAAWAIFCIKKSQVWAALDKTIDSAQLDLTAAIYQVRFSSGIGLIGDETLVVTDFFRNKSTVTTILMSRSSGITWLLR